MGLKKYFSYLGNNYRPVNITNLYANDKTFDLQTYVEYMKNCIDNLYYIRNLKNIMFFVRVGSPDYLIYFGETIKYKIMIKKFKHMELSSASGNLITNTARISSIYPYIYIYVDIKEGDDKKKRLLEF
jgi:hypothetical protein